jgi:hypothetical protein
VEVAGVVEAPFLEVQTSTNMLEVAVAVLVVLV